MEFRERLTQTLGERMPKEPKLSALTQRIILTAKEYQNLQVIFTFDAYNLWCAGVNKKVDPRSDPMIAVENFIDTGDAKNFSDLFITEREAELEVQEAKAKSEAATAQPDEAPDSAAT